MWKAYVKQMVRVSEKLGALALKQTIIDYILSFKFDINKGVLRCCASSVYEKQ